jgi:hypothetical protein
MQEKISSLILLPKGDTTLPKKGIEGILVAVVPT